MKRATWILVAALAVLLVYPATMPSAKSPDTGNTPPTITPNPGPGPYDDPDLNGDGDNGDGDGLGGFNGGGKKDGLNTAAGLGTPESMAKIWWMYFMMSFWTIF